MKARLLIIPLIVFSSTGCIHSNGYSGDVYNSAEAKQIHSVAYGTVVHIRTVTLQAEQAHNALGTVGGAVLGGFLGNTIGGGRGRSLATAAGAVAGGVAGQAVEGSINKSQGVELEIRKDDGNTIMVVQAQGNTTFSVGERVALVSDGKNVTVSPR